MFRSRLFLLCSLLLPLQAGAEYLGDPNDLQVFIGDDGTFGEITLDNTVIDSLYPQRQFANGEELVADGNGVTVDPTGAYYTATITDFQIDVRSVIRGPLNLTTAPNSVFEQYFTFTNTSGVTRSLESVAFYQSYLDDTLDDDVVQQDNPRPIVYSTDAPSGQLVALAAREQTYTVKWQVADAFGIYDGVDPPTTAGLSDNAGPIAATVDPVEMAVGVDAGDVAPGAQVTLLYYYLFSTDMDVPPWNFPVPAPGALVLVGLGLVGVIGMRTRRARRNG